MNLDQITAAYGEPNAKAWLRVIRERESSQDDSAYTVINGGAHFEAPPWRHPYAGQSAPPGRASGAYQYIPHTWQAVAAALGFGDDFSPVNQDLGALYLTAGRGALDDVLRGDVSAACVKCRPEWTSLPGATEASASWTVDKAIAVFKRWGGTVAGEQPAAPIEEAPPAIPASTRGVAMNPLALLQMFGPILSGLIPQVKTIINPPPESNAARNVDLAQLLINAIIQGAGVAPPVASTPAAPQVNAQQQQMSQLAAAITAMQADVATQKKVVAAVLNEPTIQGLLEVGGGIKAAREASIVMQNAEKPIWYNPTFLISAAFFPMMYLITAAVLFTVYSPDAANDTPYWARVGFDQATRSGLVNLIVGMVFGGVVGVWFGTSYGSQRKTEIAAQATTEAVTKA